MKTRIFSALAALLLAVSFGPLARADDDPPGVVGRITYTDGSVLMQMAGEADWQDANRNQPLTDGDKLWVASGARAELHIGSTAVRLGEATALQAINIDDEGARLSLTAGMVNVRVRNLAAQQTLLIETPNGDVAILRAGEYRINVRDDGYETELVVHEGRALLGSERSSESVVNSGQSARVTEDDPSPRFTGTSGRDSFDLWARERHQREDSSRSARYVSRDVIGYTDLDYYGDWRDEPGYGGYIWYPRVATSWAPYHHGRWAWVGAWGWTWVDDAPWGFAPTHYGRWVSVRGRWGWVPPGRGALRPYYAPALVAWVGGSNFSVSFSFGGPSRIGWFPLGYNEVYVPWRGYSRNYFHNVNRTNIFVDNTVINNYYDGSRRQKLPERRYINQHVPGAVAAVSHQTFTGGRPIGRNRLAVAEADVRRAPVQAGGGTLMPNRTASERVARTDRPQLEPPRTIGRDKARMVPSPRSVETAQSAPRSAQPIPRIAQPIPRNAPAEVPQQVDVPRQIDVPRGAPVQAPRSIGDRRVVNEPRFANREREVPDRSAPMQSAPMQSIPRQSAPEQRAPRQNEPAQSAPREQRGDGGNAGSNASSNGGNGNGGNGNGGNSDGGSGRPARSIGDRRIVNDR